METAPVMAVTKPSMTMLAIIFLPSSSAMRVEGMGNTSRCLRLPGYRTMS